MAADLGKHPVCDGIAGRGVECSDPAEHRDANAEHVGADGGELGAGYQSWLSLDPSHGPIDHADLRQLIAVFSSHFFFLFTKSSPKCFPPPHFIDVLFLIFYFWFQCFYSFLLYSFTIFFLFIFYFLSSEQISEFISDVFLNLGVNWYSDLICVECEVRVDTLIFVDFIRWH